FVQGTTVANFGANITVNSLTVHSPTTATANITVQNNAALGARTVTLTTGGEVATLTGGFTVVAPLTVVSFRVLFGTMSYDVAAASNTRVRLPWQVAGVEVVFSRPVVSGNINSLGGLTPTSLAGVGTNTLTWRFTPVSVGNIVATLAGSGANALSDANGVSLGAGAGYTRGLKVLWGDFNDDGSVSAADLASVGNARVTPYNLFADLNGDGTIDINDLQIVRARIGTSLQ
ncbi:MAG TPA: dockerin type I domain-containing protein, partial [Bryobacteraceae bacterium]|nr:dockerin type I domain-containing protein [Bryobacteraceae bacterium]